MPVFSSAKFVTILKRHPWKKTDGRRSTRSSVYTVEVDDVQACLGNAASLGGKTLVPPVKIPTGTFAWFSDPEGNPSDY